MRRYTLTGEQIAKALPRRLRGLSRPGDKATVEHLANFTVAFVELAIGTLPEPVHNRAVIGVAKRNPTDRDDDDIGTRIALSRAYDRIHIPTVNL